MEERQEEYDEVATEQYKVLIATYGVAAVGINLPRIFNLILVEPGKSFVRVIQSIGCSSISRDDLEKLLEDEELAEPESISA